VEGSESRIEEILGRKDGSNFFIVKDELTEIMFKKFGIFRDAKRMEEGLNEIKIMQEKLSNLTPNNKSLAVNQTLIQFLELEGMLKIAEVVAYGAIRRKESRGSHTRIDHPDRDDDNYLKHTLATLRNGKIDISYKPVNLEMFEPKERVY
jgi:succinate dehydrogenase / fumarate reductase flavoprotein subunit